MTCWSLSLGDFGEDIEWEKLLTLACSSLEHVSSSCGKHTGPCGSTYRLEIFIAWEAIRRKVLVHEHKGSTTIYDSQRQYLYTYRSPTCIAISHPVIISSSQCLLAYIASHIWAEDQPQCEEKTGMVINKKLRYPSTNSNKTVGCI